MISNPIIRQTSQDTRTHVVRELYNTESSYVESLQILVEKYMKPLKSQALIDSNLVDEIFFTIPEILSHHENFLDALQERLPPKWDSSQVIGDVFIKAFTNQQIIDTYTKFINNWKNARHAIKVTIQAKPAFEKFLETTLREHKNKLDLDALLIMPVQRIPRYELMIKELIKHTPQDHPDHGPLMEAQKKIHELALKIDRAEREMLHQERLKDLEALIENHAGLIQNPHREFIRYDLVTISTSTLAVTRKERVLFLFCDLLIMTSVKKKVSRRSNLQAAFANSDHDISLLEGNKFKLILRLNLDRVDIRCDNDEQTQLLQQQQQYLEQKLVALAQHKKLIQDKKQELESDLLVLRQMELLSSQLIHADKATLGGSLAKSMEQVHRKLNNLELQQSDCEISDISLQSSTQDSFLIQVPAAATMSTSTSNHQSNGLSLGAKDLQQQASNTASSEQDHQSGTKQSDASLEFIFMTINNDLSSKELLSTNSKNSSKTLDEISGQQNGSGKIHNLMSSSTPDSQPHQEVIDFERLVVSFPSRDRRQAFILAFLEAKQKRLKQKQKRMLSSSVGLKLSQPDQPLMKSRSIASDMRRNRLQHQDEVLEIRNNNSLGKHLDRHNDDDRISSAPCAGTIGRCASCSSNYTLESADKIHSKHGGHHHHQLMHQPASHPALLHTICCHEQHNDGIGRSIGSLNDESDHLAELPERITPGNTYEEEMAQLTRACYKDVGGAGDNSIELLLENDMGKRNQILMLKFVPRFLAAMPMTFLNTQHPALQVSCSVLRSSAKEFACNRANSMFELGNAPITSRSQTICDNKGQLWLCMSNGYVSHIALVEFVSQDCDKKFNEKLSKHCYTITPVVKSGGDICKSQINCAAQVGWSSRKQGDSCGQADTSAAPKASVKSESSCAPNNLNFDGIDQKSAPKPPEVSIKSASPPVNIGYQTESETSRADASHDRHISRSAPANNKIDSKLDRIEAPRLSASTAGPLETINRSNMTHTRAVICQTAGLLDRDGQKGAPRRVINHRYQPHHHHHHSQDQLRCRNHKCTPSLSCNQGSYRRYRAMGTSPTTSQPRWLNQPGNHQQPHGHHHGPHHHYHHQHQHHHHHHHHHVYSNKHHTVSLAELRRALERQSKLSAEKDQLSLPDGGGHRRHHLAPPANTPNPGKCDSLDLPDSSRALERPRESAASSGRANTPPGRHISAGTRTKQLRHQASLKTSAILAKLVSSAGKGSSYLKRSTNQSVRAKSDQSRNPSDMDDNDTDGDMQTLKSTNNQAETSSADSNLSLGPPQSLAGSTLAQANNSVVSPLSSGSSLNSSNSSSMTVNSVCVSTPMHGSCTRLFDQAQCPSSMCCVDPDQANPFMSHHQSSSSREDVNEAGFRSRSATVPCRAYCEQSGPVNYPNVQGDCPADPRPRLDSKERCTNDVYKVNEILDNLEKPEDVHRLQTGRSSTCSEDQSSLWLGCEDGSLIIIDCLTTSRQQEMCGACSDGAGTRDVPLTTCQNVHSELRLGSSISDIKSHMNKYVFVALSDGRLAIFLRAESSDGTLGEWQLENPQLITITANELNLTSKLCLIDEDHLWYSYGRNIFVLNISTLALKTTIMTPAHDKATQFAMQTVTIDSMELVPQMSGVWVSFRGSTLIQFYESREYKLLLEMSLLEPINKVLSCGNEIIRQHKTACLGTTSLLSLYNESENSNSLFIGTTAGLILVLTISQEQLREQVAAERSAWNPQVISLRHGHSGQVRFLQMIEPTRETKRFEGDLGDDSEMIGHKRGGLILVSGGSGVDLYGPNDNQQFVQHDDSLNHLVLWAV